MERIVKIRWIVFVIVPAWILLSFPAVLFSQNANRIISLAPSVTENLYLLGAQDLVVGCTNYCEVAVKDNKPVVASAVNVNLEKVVSLQPDLVIGTGLTPLETVEFLKRLDIKVRIFKSPKDFDELCQQFLEFGVLTGKQDAAKEIITDTRDELKTLLATIQPMPEKPKMLLQIGAKPLFAVIPNTFMHDYIVLAQGINIAGDLEHGTIKRETVLTRNPDIIFVVTMGMVGLEEKEIWKGYPHLSASKNNRIFVIDSRVACSPTPVNFIATLKEIVAFTYR